MDETMDIACVISGNQKSKDGLQQLEDMCEFVPAERADIIICLGGDGFMLDTLHEYIDTGKPIYGMNRGTVGFLMNEFKKDGLFDRIKSAVKQTLNPLEMSVRDIHGNTHKALAFNEVAIVRYSQQAANLKIAVNNHVRMDKLMSDGVLVCTPAGSTAYNLSVHGPVIPINAEMIGLTPISPFRPRRWRGALLPYDSDIEIWNLDPEKRPLGASADSTEFNNAEYIKVRISKTHSTTVLFDHGHSLEERIINEQFAI